MNKWLYECTQFVRKCWKSILLVLTPTVLIPFLVHGYHSKETRCAFVIIIMAVYWTFETLPLPVTALIPIVLFPMLGLATTEQACGPYLQATNMLFFASLTIAIAVESSNLHKRLAYKILMTVGTDIRYLIAGFMITAMFLGIWIINTAATAMLLPIADVIVTEIFYDNDDDIQDHAPINDSSEQSNEMINYNEQKGINVKIIEPKNKINYESRKKLKSVKNEKLRRLLYLSIAYAATIGGTTTLTKYNGLPPVDYTNWLMFCITATIITVAIVWYIFRTIYMKNADIEECTKTPKYLITQKYKELGAFTFHEIAVCLLFVLLILLWMFRDPQFMSGWATLLGHTKPKDATAAIFIVILLFMIPAQPLGPYPSPALLDWPMVQSRLAWGVILLRGGGFAMAEAATRSGLSKLIGQQLAHLDALSITGTVIIFSSLASVITEFASNSAVATILLPIAGQLASTLNVNPLMFLIPITLSCSFAFILPVSTPANALVFTHAGLKSSDMIIPGIIAKSISIIIMLLNLFILGSSIFDLNTFPEWAVTQKILNIDHAHVLNASAIIKDNLHI